MLYFCGLRSKYREVNEFRTFAPVLRCYLLVFEMKVEVISHTCGWKPQWRNQGEGAVVAVAA